MISTHPTPHHKHLTSKATKKITNTDLISNHLIPHHKPLTSKAAKRIKNLQAAGFKYTTRDVNLDKWLAHLHSSDSTPRPHCVTERHFARELVILEPRIFWPIVTSKRTQLNEQQRESRHRALIKRTREAIYAVRQGNENLTEWLENERLAISQNPTGPFAAWSRKVVSTLSRDEGERLKWVENEEKTIDLYSKWKLIKWTEEAISAFRQGWEPATDWVESEWEECKWEGIDPKVLHSAIMDEYFDSLDWEGSLPTNPIKLFPHDCSYKMTRTSYSRPEIREALIRTIIDLPSIDKDRKDNFVRTLDNKTRLAPKELLLRALFLYEFKKVLIPENSHKTFLCSKSVKPSYLPKPAPQNLFEGIDNAYTYSYYNLLYHIEPIVASYPEWDWWVGYLSRGAAEWWVDNPPMINDDTVILGPGQRG